MKSNELFNKCLANVNPEVRQEVRNNMEKILKKTKVKKGEKYWYIFIYCDEVAVDYKIDRGFGEDYARYKLGNYFATKEEAETMARKLRAVLKGAEVIEMPSEKEIKQASYDCTNGYDDDQIPGFMEGVKYLKSKTAK